MMTDTLDAVAKLVNLASPRLGTEVVQASDDFFGAKERMIQDAPSVFIPDKFDENGKWVDGWETRRRRGLGYDWCVVKLGIASLLSYVDVDTSHFTGNYPPGGLVEGCSNVDQPTDRSHWRPLMAPFPLGPNAHHLLPVMDSEPVRWLRLSIYPDGGVARLRAYGRPVIDPNLITSGQELELSALRNGGRILGYSDAHYGNPWRVLTEGRGLTMGDGWETRRRREPGNDWMLISLGVVGTISRIEVDTAHNKGNYPDKVSLQGYRMGPGTDEAIITQSMFWPELMAPQPTQAHHIHTFDGSVINQLGPITHVRLNIHPDGGLSRIRVFGHPAP